jgi:hypothetical protein
VRSGQLHGQLNGDQAIMNLIAGSSSVYLSMDCRIMLKSCSSVASRSRPPSTGR